MKEGETFLEMATRHVREAEAHVTRQREIVNELRRNGEDATDSEALLATFESLLRSHQLGFEIARRKP
jgi:hypothetical protein